MRHPLPHAALGFALALALALAAGGALAADRVPLAEEHRKAITSTRIVGKVAPGGMGASYLPVEAPGGPFYTRSTAPLAIFAGIVNAHRDAEARELARKLQEALGPFDARPRIQAALARELGKVAPFQGARVEVAKLP